MISFKYKGNIFVSGTISVGSLMYLWLTKLNFFGHAEKAAERKERIHEWIRFIARIYINRKHDTNVPVREKFAIYAIQSLFAHSSH